MAGELRTFSETARDSIKALIVLGVGIAVLAFILMLIFGVTKNIASTTGVENSSVYNNTVAAFSQLGSVMPLVALIAGVGIILAIILGIPVIREMLTGIVGGGGGGGT